MTGLHRLVTACLVCAALVLGQREAHAQGHDSLLNGVLIGAAVGTGAGVSRPHCGATSR
jgi:hypothetical protein